MYLATPLSLGKESYRASTHIGKDIRHF